MNINKLIKNLKEHISKKGFNYPEYTVEALYISLKVYPFAVVSGPAGSGKSSLARFYAEAMGATPENGRFKNVPVCSGWITPARVFGNVTPDGKFVPGILTGLIQRASSDPDYPYFVCFDGLNLSRPEQYLSVLLSVLETRRWQSGKIITDAMFDKESFGNDISATFEYGGIYIPENLYFIGTLNNDDVSFALTPGFVDRVNIVSLENPDFTDLFIKNNFDKKINSSYEVLNSATKSEYIHFNECKYDDVNISTETEFLQKINNSLNKINCSLSMRSINNILLFIFYSHKLNLIDSDIVIDLIMMQKILPRISGNNPQIKSVLASISNSYLKNDLQKLVDDETLNKAKNVCNKDKSSIYRRSTEKISDMIRRYDNDGFTSFWE